MRMYTHYVLHISSRPVKHRNRATGKIPSHVLLKHWHLSMSNGISHEQAAYTRSKLKPGDAEGSSERRLVSIFSFDAHCICCRPPRNWEGRSVGELPEWLGWFPRLGTFVSFSPRLGNRHTVVLRLR